MFDHLWDFRRQRISGNRRNRPSESTVALRNHLPAHENPVGVGDLGCFHPRWRHARNPDRARGFRGLHTYPDRLPATGRIAGGGHKPPRYVPSITVAIAPFSETGTCAYSIAPSG